MKKNILRCLAIVMSLALTSCYVHESGIEGTFTDAKTGLPIPDVLVDVQWTKPIRTIAGTSDQCIHAEVMKTRSDGTFRVPSWTIFGSEYALSFNDPVQLRWVVYKPGYSSFFVGEPNRGDYRLRQFAGAPQERLYELTSVIGMCNGQWLSFKDEITLMDAALQEVYQTPGGTAPLMINGEKSIPSELILNAKCFLETKGVSNEKRSDAIQKCAEKFRKKGI